MKTKGQALVEMAIVIVLLFLLVFGIFQFGWLMYIKNTLNNAARAGVRQAIVTPSLTDTPYAYGSFPDSATSDLVKQKIDDSLSYVNKAEVKAQLDVVGKTGSQVAVANDTVTLTITLRDIQVFAPGFISIASMLPLENGKPILKGQASMRYE
jgi:Flp pilus assembly protein TadG